jgi:hypothetical protein
MKVLEGVMQRPDLSDVDKRFADGVVGRLIAADDEYRTSTYQPHRLFRGRFNDVAGLQGATFQVEPEVHGLSEPPRMLSPLDRYDQLASPSIQIPACPLFKRKLQLYGSTS